MTLWPSFEDEQYRKTTAVESIVELKLFMYDNIDLL